MNDPSSLRAHDLTLGYGDRDVLAHLELDVPSGRTTTILGPNGCGKSTLLHALARTLAPRGGSVLLDGRDIQAHPTRAVAQRLALLPQSAQAPAELRVRDLVEFGRFPYRGWLGGKAKGDDAKVAAALAAVHLEPLADRLLHTLSGGERQRAWIAMALAQETHFLLLDEPTTSLDIAHRLEVLELVAELRRVHHKTIVMVLHDMDLAARFSDHLVLMRDGLVRASGAPREVMTADVLRDVFRVEGHVFTDPHLGTPTFVPHRSVTDRARADAPHDLLTGSHP